MRALSIGLMVLGLMGIALVGVSSPAIAVNKVVIGVLDFETSGPYIEHLEEQKKALMKELRRNTRVKLVDMGESCGLSDLKRHGYERAERYKDIYQLDMILHTDLISGFPHSSYDLRLLDLYTKQVRKVSIEVDWDASIGLRFRGISKKLLVSKDLNRVLSEKKEVLAKKEVTVPAEAKEIPKRETKEIPPPVTSINKVVIGVLDFEASGGHNPFERKKALMKELRRNTRVKLVDIRESCGLSDLKRNGYEKAERYKMNYQLDIILHILQIHWSYSFSLIDLYTKKIKEVSIESAWNAPIEFMFKGISQKLLVSGDLNRVLREKKKVLAKKEATVPKEVRRGKKRSKERRKSWGKKR